MDIQTEKEGPWRRVKPDQARGTARARTGGPPPAMNEEDLAELLGSTENNE